MLRVGYDVRRVSCLAAVLVLLVFCVPALPAAAVGVDAAGTAGLAFQAAEPFGDDFSDPGSGWTVDRDAEREFLYGRGVYQVRVTAPDMAVWSWSPSGEWTDFTVEVDARLVSGPASTAYGLAFRGVDDANFYFAIIDEAGAFLLGKLDEDEWATVEDLEWVETGLIEEGVANRLSITAIGDAIEFYINDELVAAVRDESFQAGSIGVYVEKGDERQAATVTFDNFEIFPEDAPEPPADTGQSALVEDDFSSPDTGWPVVEGEDRRLGYEDGEYVMHVFEPELATWVSSAEDAFADFTLQIEARALESETTPIFGLIFRHQDDSFYYFTIDDEGWFNVGKYTETDGWSDLEGGEWQESDALNVDGETNHLMVVTEGPLISVYANDELLLTLEDDTLEGGGIGMYVESIAGSDPVAVAFDNLSLRIRRGEPPEPEGGVVLFEDNFEGRRQFWETISDDEQEFAYVDGELLGTVKVGDLVAWNVADAGTFSDFALETDVRLADGPSDGQFGLVFRLQEGGNFYYFQINDAGQWLAGKDIDREWQNVDDIEDWMDSEYLETGGAVNRLRVVANGGEISLYANGHLLASFEDDSLSTGEVGVIVGTQADSDPVTAAFDNFLVTELGSGGGDAGAVSFSDDFSDPDSGWREAEFDDSAVYYDDGEYIMTVTTPDVAAWEWAPVAEVGDFVYEADVRLVEGVGSPSFGLIFRGLDNDNFYYFLVDDEGGYSAGKREDGEWAGIGVDWNTTDALVTGGATNRLQVVAAGNELSFYANDELLVSITDDSLSYGTPGLMVEKYEGKEPLVVAFDNVSLVEGAE